MGPRRHHRLLLVGGGHDLLRAVPERGHAGPRGRIPQLPPRLADGGARLPHLLRHHAEAGEEVRTDKVTLKTPATIFSHSRPSVAFSLILGGICCIVEPFIPASIRWLDVGLFMLGKVREQQHHAGIFE